MRGRVRESERKRERGRARVRESELEKEREKKKDGMKREVRANLWRQWCAATTPTAGMCETERVLEKRARESKRD